MPHPVICSICGKRFDRDSVQAVRTGTRRYAHAECEPDNKDFVPLVIKKKSNSDMQQLKDYINEKYGTTANWALIQRQIKQYQKDYKYSLSGILKSLIWFFDIKGNSIENSKGGIGIVPFAYQDAYNYYYSIFLANQANENKSVNNEIKELTIPPPQARNYLKRTFFNLDEWEPDNEE